MELRSNGNTLPTVPRMVDRPIAAAHQSSSLADTGTVELETAQAVQKPPAAAERAKLDDALHSINKSMQALSQDLEFSVDPDSDRAIVKVIDQRTKEVIRQMPSEETLEIAKALDRVQGLLIRQIA